MDPVKFHLDNRPGVRKTWDELSNNGKRKRRKVYFDSLDSKLNYIESSNSNSTSTTSYNLNNDEIISVNIIENSESENLIADAGCSLVPEANTNDFNIDNFVSASTPTILIDNFNDNLTSDKTATISDFTQHNTALAFLNNSNISLEVNDCDNSEKIHETLQSNNNSGTNEPKKIYKPTGILSVEETLKSNLSNCIVHNKINQVQANALLNVLRAHPLLKFLPRDARSLLKTPRDKIEIKHIAPGEYIHLGLEVMLKSILNRVTIESIPSELLIDFSTDGAELNKEIQMWPIQFRVVNLEYNKPELVGMYKGTYKPNSATDFFLDFVNEVNAIHKKGGITYNDKKIPIKIRCFVADAPARSYVLNHYGHNSEYPCSKCHLKGLTHINSKRYPGINYKLRTNEEYRLLTDVDHNKGKSALHDLSFDSVQQVPFDYMHLVCLGVVKKVIESVVFGKCNPQKLPVLKKNILSNRFTTLQLYCPREFARNPRGLDQFNNFKATEFRQLLLYTFIVVFRGVISDEQCNHFLLLHSSMRILLNHSSPENLDFADESLKTFVLKAEDVHGLQFLTYNAHGILHLVADYKLYGPLDSISAFPYENNMPKYRQCVRKPDKPLQQVYKRIQEESQFPVTNNINTEKFKAYNTHNCGPIVSAIENISTQYESLQKPSFFFSIHNTDNTIINQNSQIGIIKNIIFYNNDYYFAVYFFRDLQSF